MHHHLSQYVFLFFFLGTAQLAWLLFTCYSNTSLDTSKSFEKENIYIMMNLDIVFRICNIVVGCFMIIGGLFTIFAGGSNRSPFFSFLTLDMWASSTKASAIHRVSKLHQRHLLHALWYHGVRFWVQTPTHGCPARFVHVQLLRSWYL